MFKNTMCPYHIQRKATIVEYVPSSGKNRFKIVIIPYLQAPHMVIKSPRVKMHIYAKRLCNL
jgi:hypothetical protein